jgi:hypothetical protein
MISTRRNLSFQLLIQELEQQPFPETAEIMWDQLEAKFDIVFGPTDKLHNILESILQEIHNIFNTY